MNKLKQFDLRLKAIDGLRALAILSVIAFHFNILPSGFIGVDIFFVISGYVITLSLSKYPVKSNVSYIAEFYKRRILRIMPALVFMLVVVEIFSKLFIPESWLSSSNNDTGFFAFFGLSNFALISGADGYFNHRAEFNPFLHTWSLAVEEQFYLLFPIMLLPWLKQYLKGRAKLFSKLVFYTAILSLVWSVYETSYNHLLAFYMLPSRFWELASGAVLFQCHTAGRCIPNSIKSLKIVTFIGLVLIVYGLFYANPQKFPFPWALTPVIGTLLLISAARSYYAEKSYIINILKYPLTVYIGRSSYSLYLWHWPIIVLLRWTIGFNILTALILTLILGLSSYHFIEKPFLDSNRLRQIKAYKIVPSGIAIIGISAIVFNFIIKSSISLSVVNKDIFWHPWNLPNHKNKTLSNKRNFTSTLWLIGDSHAGAYTGMAREAAAKAGMKFKIITGSGCPFANLRTPNKESNYCKKVYNKIFKELSKNYSKGDIVFLASLRGQRLSDQWGKFEPKMLNYILNSDRSKEYNKAYSQARKIIKQLTSIGYTVIIDTPKPVFRAPPFRCSDWFNRMNPVCSPGFKVSAAELKEIDAPVIKSLNKLKTEFPKLIVWDPFSILCPGDICSTFKDGKPLFFDQDHLSGYGNQLLLPSFTKLLLRLKYKH